MKKIIWDTNADLIFVVDSTQSFVPSDTSITGTISGNDIIFDANSSQAPANMDYFVRLWNAQYPQHKITLDNVKLQGDMGRMANSKKHHPMFDENEWWKNWKRYQAELDNNPQLENRFIGNLGEHLVRNIPGVTPLEDPRLNLGAARDPFDALFSYNGVPYAVEVKSNSFYGNKPYYYRLTGYGKYTRHQLEQAKIKKAIELGYHVGGVGVTHRYHQNKADVYFKPDVIGQFSHRDEQAIPLAKDHDWDYAGFVPVRYRHMFQDNGIVDPSYEEFIKAFEDQAANGGIKRRVRHPDRVVPETRSPEEIFG